MPELKPLTEKQARFVDAYVVTGNASEAYRQAYDAANMSPDTIKKRASELMAHAGVKAKIEALRAKAHAKAVETAGLNDAYVLEALKENMDVALARRTIKLKVMQRDKDSGDVSVVDIETSAHDATAANKAVELSMKYLGMFEVDNGQQAQAKVTVEFSPLERARSIAFLLEKGRQQKLEDERLASGASAQPTAAQDPARHQPQDLQREDAPALPPEQHGGLRHLDQAVAADPEPQGYMPAFPVDAAMSLRGETPKPPPPAPKPPAGPPRRFLHLPCSTVFEIDVLRAEAYVREAPGTLTCPWCGTAGFSTFVTTDEETTLS